MPKARPFQVASAYNRSRVVPGTSSTIASRSPIKRLKRVLLPTLGRQTRATIGFDIEWLRVLRPFLKTNYGLMVGTGVGARTTSTVAGSNDSTVTFEARIWTVGVS